AIRTASEKGKLVIGMPATPSLPWLKPTRSPENSILLKNYRQLLIEQDANSIKSDTGELYRNWKDGLYTIDTPESQAVMGWLGGKSLELSNTRYRIKTVNATIVVQSLDNKSISESKKILVSLGSNSVPYKDLNGRSKLPFYTQPVTGHIWIEAREGLRVYAISNLGTKDELPGNYKEGRYEIDLELARGSHWLILDNS
ncbi:MAG TPA: glycosyl hydrolase family 5, partial [Gammaproteobacteria bacterium]|nr:glycosyl hydrolase family 5 [Gammaproteobacteria bacterium]